MDKNFWVLINFKEIALNGKVANVLILTNIGIEWIQNQTFLHLNQYRPPVNLLPSLTLYLLYLEPQPAWFIYRTACVE